MQVAERSATVRWQGDMRTGQGITAPGSGAFSPLPLSFSDRLESQAPTSSPEELIAAAHASCYAMSLAGVLSSNGFHADRLVVTAHCKLNRGEDGLRIQTIELQAEAVIPRIDDAAYAELALKAEGRSTVSNALRGSVEIVVQPRLLTGTSASEAA